MSEDQKGNNCNCYLMCTLKKVGSCRFYQPGDKLNFQEEDKEVYRCVWSDDSSWCHNTAANYHCLMAYLHALYKDIEDQLAKKELNIAVLRNQIIQQRYTKYPVGGKTNGS